MKRSTCSTAGSGGSRRRLAVALLAVLGAVLLLMVILGVGRGARRAAAEEAAGAASAPEQGRHARPSPMAAIRRASAREPLGPRGPQEDDEATRAIARRAARVSDAFELLRFPPDSQPLRSGMVDVLEPNRRHETPLPLALATGRRDPPKPGDLSFVFTADAYSVVGDDSLVATLEVFREQEGTDRERVAVDVLGLSLSLADGTPVNPAPAALIMKDDGRGSDATSGDKIYSVAVTPSAVPALASYRGLVRLELEFVPHDGDGRPARASLDFRVSDAVPASVAGVPRERLTAEGLELGLDLRVVEPGHYFVQGLLFDADDEPIGFAVARPRLAAGRSIVPLLFWGLLFHEAAAEGRFVLRTVTGHRLPQANEKDRADMPIWDGPYRTQAYPLSAFSEAEYESPGKDLKIEALSALAARNPERVQALTPAPR
jgi:hypothetical protein